MGDKLWINDTKIHEDGAEVASPRGYGLIWAVDVDFGAPTQETFLDPRSMAPGMRFNGTVTKDRPFRVRISIADVASRAEGQDEWGYFLGNVINTDNGLFAFKSERLDGGGGDVARELLAIVTGEPAWSYTREGGGDGLRPNGNLVITLDCVAPFPWWRDVEEQTRTINFSGTSVGSLSISRDGDTVCGAQIKVSTTGTLASLAVADGVNTMALTAAFGASAKGVDWFYGDPSATAIDAGVVISDLSNFEMHSPTTTVACTPPGTATGNHTAQIKFKPLWKAP